ncbi:MAG: aldose epimerase family protein [Paracoccaceae bacterium]
MIEEFDHLPDGKPVHRVTLVNGGLTARFLTYGAILQDLRLEGHEMPLVLGFPQLQPYFSNNCYLGATVGRCANRVAGGHFENESGTHQLETNYLEKHCLHGGSQGLACSLWALSDWAEDRVAFAVRQTDGHMGFPGNLDVKITFSLLPKGCLDILIEAETDAPTLCSIAHHSYFNLDGAPTISEHELRLAALSYLPVDEEGIPTGQQVPVDDTRFDFTSERSIGPAHPIDHNFCLSQHRQILRPVAWLRSPSSGVALECRTTEAGLQVYDGRHIDIKSNGLLSRPMGAYSGLALEPQNWPDSNHHPEFPQAVLRPGEKYVQKTQFVFAQGS